jgi:LPXTG-motif cell wall-anchored protein
LKKKLHKRRIGTKIVSTVLASTLFLPPISPIFQHGQLIGFEQNTAQADPLASVRILDNTELTADARETDPTEPYTLDMTLTGRGLADADLVNPETVAVFYAPQLAGDLGENATANVAVEILPITLSDIPALGDTLSGLTGTLTTTLSEVLGLVDDLLVMLPGVDINGVDELSEAFNALNTLDVAVEDLLAYSENIPAEDITVNENGVVTVNFSDGIDNHLNTAINETVLGLVNDVIDAAQALEVDLGLLDILPFAQELVNSILGLVTDSVLPLAQGLVNDLAGATLDLTGDLAAAQVIGNTTVNVSVPVDRSTSMAGQEVRVSGNVVNTADIDAQLLSDLDNSDTTTLVQMPEAADTTAPTITPIDDVEAIEGQDITPIEVTADEPATFTVEGLPEGVTYNEDASTITGTPVIDDWAEDEVARPFAVIVEATDEAGNTDLETFVMTVQRDSNGDGIPDVDDTVDMTAPTIDSIDDFDAIDNQAIAPVDVIVDEASDIAVDGLPEGITYDPDASEIAGAPALDWADGELQRNFAVIVEATDDAGNTGVETFVITVYRDSNNDGTPDVEDPSDEDTTAPMITPIDNVETVESQDIEPIEVVTDEESTIEVSNLPDGVYFDEDSSTIEGAPVIDDWEEDEVERDFAVVVSATDEAGNTGLESFVMTVQRDSDGNGIPDVDEPGDTEAPVISPIDNATAIEGQDIETIDVVTDEESTIEVSNLPDGVYFDEGSSAIVGTPTIDDWEENEVERDFAVVVAATDEADNTGLESFVMTVQRDSDGDGTPDIDEEEPEDSTTPEIEPIDDFDAVEYEPIEPVEIIVDEDSTVAVDGLPSGVDYNPSESVIEGTPVIEDWAEDEFTRDFEVVVEAINEEGNTGTEEFVVTVERALDDEDTTAPVITPIDDFNAVENQPIDPVEVIVDEDSTVAVDGLPSGVDYNPSESVIEGTPIIEDWAEDEFTRDFVVVVEATDEAGNTGTEEFVVTIERDSNDDGTSNVEDDDNGDVNGEDTTPPVITPIPDQTVEENEPIEDIPVETDEPSEVVVDGLPDGLEYDLETGIIGGTPVINDWNEGETEREFTVTITAEDDAGNVSSMDFSFVIERDLSGLGGVNDGSDSTDSSQLPQTGESQSITTSLLGIASLAIGAIALAWTEKRKGLNEE